MTISFEQVRGLITQWINEANAHMSAVFPHVSVSTLEPVIREQVEKAVNELLTATFEKNRTA